MKKAHTHTQSVELTFKWPIRFKYKFPSTVDFWFKSFHHTKGRRRKEHQQINDVCCWSFFLIRCVCVCVCTFRPLCEHTNHWTQYCLAYLITNFICNLYSKQIIPSHAKNPKIEWRTAAKEREKKRVSVLQQLGEIYNNINTSKSASSLPSPPSTSLSFCRSCCLWSH